MHSNTSSANVPDGVWPVMLTPFDDALHIDLKAYGELVDWYIASGSAGVFATCGSSEISELTECECLDLVTRTVELVAGRVPIAAGAILRDRQRQADHAQRIADRGADIVVVAANQFAEAHEDDRVLVDRIMAFLDDVDPSIALGIYEYPHPHHRVLRAQDLGMLAATGRFVFVKDTCARIDELRRKLEAIAGTPMRLFNAHALTLHDSLELGAAGYCGVLSNFFFEPLLWMCRHRKRDRAVTARVQTTIERAMAFVPLNYPANAKAYLQRRGLPIHPTCRLQVAPQPLQAAELDGLWQLHEQMVREILPADFDNVAAAPIPTGSAQSPPGA